MSATTARKKPPIPPRPMRIHCECVHYDALTCIAEAHHMSRFNASLVFATNGERNGRCTCRCHLDAQGNPISEQDWQRRRALPEDRLKITFVAVPAPFVETRGRKKKHPARPEEIEA